MRKRGIGRELTMRKCDGVRVHDEEERWDMSSHKRKGNGVRVDHEKKSDGVRIHHEKKSDGVRVYNKKERWGESSP